MSIYFTQIMPREAIWGGALLRDTFGFPHDFGDNIGEAWSFCALKDNANVLINGDYPQQTLVDLWHEHPELFNSRHDDFPFIVKIIAPEADLSIQVHPNDEMAQKCGYPFGKNEAWFFLSAQKDAHIVYGHNAKNEAELRSFIAADAWDDLVRRMPIKKDDTIYVPSGTLHALCKGSVVYEIQLATDITYRFYDYSRLDAQGNARPLHLEQAIACLRYDDMESKARSVPQVHHLSGCTETICLSNHSFVVRKLVCCSKCTLHYTSYQLCTVIDGKGIANGYALKKGDSFLLPAGETLNIEGTLTLLTSAEE